jgi:uncharacterized protein YhhL (DUF1145 family)
LPGGVTVSLRPFAASKLLIPFPNLVSFFEVVVSKFVILIHVAELTSS